MSIYSLFFYVPVNILRLQQKGQLFADDNFECHVLNENIWISNRIALKCDKTSVRSVKRGTGINSKDSNGY